MAVVNIEGSSAKLAFNVVYALKSVSSGRYLDGRDNKREVYMTDREPKGDKYLNWTIVKTNQGYALKCVSAGRYLDGRDTKRQAYMTDRDPTNDKYLQWTFHKTNGGLNGAYPHIAIRNTLKGRYLDGRDGDKHAYMTARDPTNDAYLQWIIIPMDYKLEAVVSQFDFGDYSKIEQKLEANKTLAFVDKKAIKCDVKGLSVESTFSRSIDQSFSFGFTQTIGISVETHISAGIPGLGETKATVKGSFDFGANQQWTKSQQKKYDIKYSFTPEETGDYQVGLMVYETTDAKLPFTSKVVITATTEDGQTTYSAAQIQGLMYYNGFNCKITKVGDDFIEADITGILTASYAVFNESYSKKIA